MPPCEGLGVYFNIEIKARPQTKLLQRQNAYTQRITLIQLGFKTVAHTTNSMHLVF